jgi:hypothetical protein
MEIRTTKKIILTPTVMKMRTVKMKLRGKKKAKIHELRMEKPGQDVETT